jgi:hypothetical protein
MLPVIFVPISLCLWVSRRLEEEETRGGREERRKERWSLDGRGLVGFLPWDHVWGARGRGRGRAQGRAWRLARTGNFAGRENFPFSESSGSDRGAPHKTVW